MRAISAMALFLGLGVFALVIVLVILAVNNPSPLYAALLGIAAAALAPFGFELCRFAFRSGDKEYRFFSGGYRGYLFDIVSMLLAICLTVATVIYQHPSRLLCDGRLSAGFPLAFICDASGESPLSSAGKIDWADLDSLNIPGLFVDVLFYTMLLWLARPLVSRFSPLVIQRTRSQYACGIWLEIGIGKSLIPLEAGDAEDDCIPLETRQCIRRDVVWEH